MDLVFNPAKRVSVDAADIVDSAVILNNRAEAFDTMDPTEEARGRLQLTYVDLDRRGRVPHRFLLPAN